MCVFFVSFSFVTARPQFPVFNASEEHVTPANEGLIRSFMSKHTANSTDGRICLVFVDFAILYCTGIEKKRDEK